MTSVETEAVVERERVEVAVFRFDINGLSSVLTIEVDDVVAVVRVRFVVVVLESVTTGFFSLSLAIGCLSLALLVLSPRAVVFFPALVTSPRTAERDLSVELALAEEVAVLVRFMTGMEDLAVEEAVATAEEERVMEGFAAVAIELMALAALPAGGAFSSMRRVRVRVCTTIRYMTTRRRMPK